MSRWWEEPAPARGSEEPNWDLFRDVNVSWAEKLQEQRGQKDEDRQGRNKTLSNTNQFHLFHPWRSSLDPAVPITGVQLPTAAPVLDRGLTAGSLLISSPQESSLWASNIWHRVFQLLPSCSGQIRNLFSGRGSPLLPGEIGSCKGLSLNNMNNNFKKERG